MNVEFPPKPTEQKKAEIKSLSAFDLQYFHELEGPDGWIALGQENCSNQQYFTVLDNDGNKLGIVGVFNSGDNKNLTHTVVDPKFRNQGLASKFNQKLMAELNLPFITMTIDLDNKASISAVKKLPGIKKVSDEAYEGEFHKVKYIYEQPQPESNIINIGLKGGGELEGFLSNFAPTPFDLDGVHYESVEGFWQSIKFPEGSEARAKTALLTGGKAKRAGKKAGEVTGITYQGQTIQVGSPEHHELMKRAIRAKLKQNPEGLKLLLATGDKLITHVLTTDDGRTLPDSKTIPSAVFCQILMDLRKEFHK